MVQYRFFSFFCLLHLYLSLYLLLAFHSLYLCTPQQHAVETSSNSTQTTSKKWKKNNFTFFLHSFDRRFVFHSFVNFLFAFVCVFFYFLFFSCFFSFLILQFYFSSYLLWRCVAVASHCAFVFIVFSCDN